MKRTLRSGIVLILTGLLGIPLSAESTQRVKPPEHAKKGEQIVVTLRDGREIRGEVEGWIDDVGFHVRPADGSTWLVHPEDIVTMRDAGTGTPVDVPNRGPHRMSAGTKALIVIGATIGGLFLLRAMIPPMG